jgi:hypothetical protein
MLAGPRMGLIGAPNGPLGFTNGPVLNINGQSTYVIYIYIYMFCYGVYNQCESFICLNIMVKNIEVPIERYFKWWISTKLV